MYPLLVASFAAHASSKFPNFPDFNYPAEVRRTGFQHLPVLSYCRNQAEQAIRETGGLADVSKDQSSRMRWRASVAYDSTHGMRYADQSRLELFMETESESKVEDRPLRLVYSAPLCGPEFNALPLVLRLGLELLIRKECNGSDPE